MTALRRTPARRAAGPNVPGLYEEDPAESIKASQQQLDKIT
jgi:hypothetical protein